MTITNNQAQAVLQVLTQKAKHRSGQPFSNELLGYLRNLNGQSYYFLSEDYYKCELVSTGNPHLPLKVVVETNREDILNRTVEANRELATIFS